MMASSTIEPASPAPAAPRFMPIAPMASTVVLVALVVAVSLLSANTQHKFAAHQGKLPLYATTFVWEWVLFGIVWWSVHRRGVRVRDLVNARWKSPEMALLDVALAAGFWLVAAGVLAGLGYALGLGNKANLDAARKTIGFLVPGNALEIALWVVLSATAGFCEEVIFRGYLQRQFMAVAQNVWGGILLSAIVFGFAHGYEGPRRMLLIAVYGAMFGVLAHFRKSLVPGMVAHAWHDGFAGVMLHVMKMGA
jgi:membrane protease YdiL (CAAX protease family)